MCSSDLASTHAADSVLTIQGQEGLGKGQHIVFVTGEEYYRSEEGMSMFAKIMARHHGFKCTVLFDIDPALPRWATVDGMRLQQVLINLADNASCAPGSINGPSTARSSRNVLRAIVNVQPSVVSYTCLPVREGNPPRTAPARRSL